MSGELAGKAAVVTGAGRGIGREVALAMAQEGANVIAVDPGVTRDGSGRDTSPVESLVEEIKSKGVEGIPICDSVTDFEIARKIIQTCVDKFGKLDILFSGAGILRERMIHNLTEDEWDTVIAVHLKGTFNLCRHACVQMRQQRYGRIINVTSDAWRGAFGQCNYAAAKGGIVSLTRSIAREVGRLGVTCNCICPIAATRMTVTEEVRAAWKKRVEAGLMTPEQYQELLRMPGPEYVAPLAVYLATDDAAAINGQVLGIEGTRVSIYSEPMPIKSAFKVGARDEPWTVDELKRTIPKTLLVGYVNPAPAEPKKTEKG